MSQYHTTAAYLSGGLCGAIWWPAGAICGKPIRKDLRGPWGFMPRDGQRWSFRDAMLSLLCREGGDFQNAQFTIDTVIRIERRRVDGHGRYTVHVKELELAQIDCGDLVDTDAYTGDFMDAD